MSSPAVTLLYSLGSCVALSIQNVAQSRKVDITPFRIEVSGTKADDLPSRFGQIIVKVVDQFVDNKKLGAEICKQAKNICTISNTLNAKVILQYDD